MKKIALAFDLTIIGLLFGSSLSVKDISRAGWAELSAQLLVTAAVVLLLTGIVKRIKN